MITKMCCVDGERDETCVFDGGVYKIGDCKFAIDLNKNGMTKNSCPHWLTAIVCDECGHITVLGEKEAGK